jgi:beta-lactamase class A
MMAYFKEAETHPAILSQGIRFTSAVQDLIGVIPYDHGTQLRLNKIYVASDLIDRMIISSDNGATYALISRLADGVLDKIFHELRLKNPQELGRDYTISSKEYALFYRALYNATYLNRTMSERALALLSKTDFADGLVAGVPHGIVVSHKYGEAVVGAGTRDQSVELHDCGIIYHPTSPYLLCVMTRERGVDLNAAFERARALVQGISGAVYESVR